LIQHHLCAVHQIHRQRLVLECLSSPKTWEDKALSLDAFDMSADPPAANGGAADTASEKPARSNSFSQHSVTSENSQTAAEYVPDV
jgi:hypothetical protein